MPNIKIDLHVGIAGVSAVGGYTAGHLKRKINVVLRATVFADDIRN